MDTVPSGLAALRHASGKLETRDVARKRYKKSDLPIVLGYFAGFGELAVHPDELDKYGFIGYSPETKITANPQQPRLFLRRSSASLRA